MPRIDFDHPQNAEELLITWLRGTTCHRQKRTIEWESPDKRFALLKHWSHAEYCGRGTGTLTCQSMWQLFDFENLSFDGGIGGGWTYVLLIEGGRWNKMRQAAMETHIEQLKSVNQS